MEHLVGKRLAVLVGCNYPNTENELRGCINDVIDMKQVVMERFEFKEDNIEVLTDRPGSEVLPTGANIKKALQKMVDGAEEGDVLYFHYSGHGTLIPSVNPHQPHRKDEAIVPCDFNLITDVDFRHLVNKLPPKTTFTFLSDSCHSGGLIDQEKEQIGPSQKTPKSIKGHTSKPKHIPFEVILEKFKQLTNINTQNIGTHMVDHFKDQASLSFRMSEADHNQLRSARGKKGDYGILLSGCQVNETSADVGSDGGKPHGAFSFAVQRVLEQNSGQLSNKEIVIKARKLLQDEEYTQHPCLYCSDENADAVFLLQPSAMS